MGTQNHYVREWRRKRGLTQLALAQACGVDRSLIAKLESGVHRYNQDILQDCARVLDCSVADLLVRHPDDPGGTWGIYRSAFERQDDTGREDLANTVEVFTRLTPEERKGLRDYLGKFQPPKMPQ
jgi:transcriptional regulator with XRE-family HTH domain